MNGPLEQELRKAIQQTHGLITAKFPTSGAQFDNTATFDAWYTNRAYVFDMLSRLSRDLASVMRNVYTIRWQKDLQPDSELGNALRRRGTFPENWEDSPDGALAALAVLLAGWVANQAAAKSRDDPGKLAQTLLDQTIRPLIEDSVKLGVNMAAEKE